MLKYGVYFLFAITKNVETFPPFCSAIQQFIQQIYAAPPFLYQFVHNLLGTFGTIEVAIHTVTHI